MGIQQVKNDRIFCNSHGSKAQASFRVEGCCRYSYLRPLRHIHIDVNGLHLEVPLQTFVPTLPTVAALLHTSEGRLRIGGESRIDTDGACLQSASYTKRSRDVRGKDGGSQAITRVVGQRDCLIFSLECLDRDHRSEYFVGV